MTRPSCGGNSCHGCCHLLYSVAGTMTLMWHLPSGTCPLTYSLSPWHSLLTGWWHSHPGSVCVLSSQLLRKIQKQNKLLQIFSRYLLPQKLLFAASTFSSRVSVYCASCYLAYLLLGCRVQNMNFVIWSRR